MKKMGYASFVLGVMMLLLLVKGICYSFENAGTCYWFSTQKKTFYEAEETCENMNGKLAQLHDQAVFEMITDKIATNRDQFWIGLHFQKKKSFRWDNEAYPESSNWLSGEPDGGGRCVRLRRDHRRHRLGDKSCRASMHFICQKRHEFDEFSIATGSQASAETIHCPLTSFRLDGSRLKCAQACIMERKCVGFVYNNTISTCTIWKMSQSCPDDMKGITVTVVERQCSWNSET